MISTSKKIIFSYSLNKLSSVTSRCTRRPWPGTSIGIIDYVTGIGNISREQYIRAGNPCRIHIAIWLNFYSLSTHLAASYSTFIVGFGIETFTGRPKKLVVSLFVCICIAGHSWYYSAIYYYPHYPLHRGTCQSFPVSIIKQLTLLTCQQHQPC